MKALLCIFSVLYGFGVGVRNLLFDLGILKSRRFAIPILCIGNITVGGTGKTPHTELLIDALRHKFRVACLSRGYKRKTSGFRLADERSTAGDIGDEPLQIHKKFPDILVACDADRVHGIEKLMALAEPPQVILLDDAFQHRYVQADKNIVLVDYSRPVMEDHLLPWGRLREGVHALKRADFLIVTKCPPNLSPIDQRIWSKHLDIKPYQQLFFSTTTYGEICPLVAGGETPQPGSECGILCVTGTHPTSRHCATPTTMLSRAGTFSTSCGRSSKFRRKRSIFSRRKKTPCAWKHATSPKKSGNGCTMCLSFQNSYATKKLF